MLHDAIIISITAIIFGIFWVFAEWIIKRSRKKKCMKK